MIRLATLTTIVSLFLWPTLVHAQLKPEEVPTFAVRVRVTSVGGEKPDGKKFSFRYGVGGQSATAEGGQWTDWLRFERSQIEAARTAVGGRSAPHCMGRVQPARLRV